VAGCTIRLSGNPQAAGACIFVCTAASTLTTFFLTAPICNEAQLRGEMECGSNYNRCTMRTGCCGNPSNWKTCDKPLGCENWRP
jgi:hypothetical protein